MGSTYSLIVMAFNRADGLRALLDSIALQNWGPERLEVVVVDDGSDPPLKDVVESFRSKLRLLYHHQPNGGVAAARNQGLRMASGDYIGFLADDYVLPRSYLDDVEAFFERNPWAQVVSFNITACGPGPWRHVQQLFNQCSFGSAFHFVDKEATYVASFRLPASRGAVFRRTVFGQVGDFEERLRVGEDSAFALKLASHGIPVCMLLRKSIEHHETLGGWGYLRQKLRYGRSVGWIDPHRRFGLLGVVSRAAAHLLRWAFVASAQGALSRFLLLSPGLYLFLVCLHLGIYLGAEKT